MIKSLYHTAASKALAAVTTGLLLTFIAACSDDEKDALSIAVSYTHLTLPTTERV